MKGSAHQGRWSTRSRWFTWTCSIVTFVALLIVWQICVSVSHTPSSVISSPSEIATALVTSWRDTLAPATAVTAYEGFVGFLISIPIGIGIGLLLDASAVFAASFYPLLAVAQMLPLITVAPLFIIWFGFEPIGKIVIVAVFSVFPIAVQTFRGMRAVPSFYSDVALTCGASRMWTRFHVTLRIAVHQIFGGMKIAGVYAFATAATAEYLGARTGLGIVLQAAFNSFETPLIFAATVIIIALTGILWGAISLAERIFFPDDIAALSEDDQ